MKKLATLVVIAAMGGLSAYAQGTVNFGNTSSFPIEISPNAQGTSATKIGGAAGGASSLLGGGASEVTLSLYVSLASAPSTFYLAGTTLNSSSTSSLAAGTFTGGNPFTISAAIDGGAFASGTIDYYFTAVSSSGTFGVETGQSAVGTGYSLGNSQNSPGAMFGSGGGLVPGFTLVAAAPEPSVMILSGLGAAAMLLYRRKK